MGIAQKNDCEKMNYTLPQTNTEKMQPQAYIFTETPNHNYDLSINMAKICNFYSGRAVNIYTSHEKCDDARNTTYHLAHTKKTKCELSPLS